jgi:ABC-type sugar transport system substrate-binding protein
MKKGTRLFAILLLLCLLMGIGSAVAEDKFVVGFANNNDVYDYCAKFRDYLKAECEALGMQVIVTDAGGDTNVQNGQIDDMIVQDCKVISAISNDLDGSVPALEAARAAGLPYVSFLTTVRNANDYDKFIYIGSQNYDAGAIQGEFLAAALPENAKIIYFTGAPNDQQYIDRKAGLMDKLAARTDVTVLAEYNVENKKDLGMSTTEDCLQAFEHFDAIVCQNDDSALGAVEALKSAGKLEGIITVGLDGSAGALESIAAGELTMSVLQDAKAQAKAGADVFAQIRDGVDPATIADVFVPFAAITKANVADFMAK